MPSLLDMFQPRSLSDEQQPIGFGDALQQRSNSLIGLGLNLMSSRKPGESAMANALQGYQQGATLDSAQAFRQAQIQHQKRQEGRQAAMDKFHRDQAIQAQTNWQQQFDRSDPAKQLTDYQRALRDLYPDGATPEQKSDLAKQWYSTKSEGNLVAQAEQRRAIVKANGLDETNPKIQAWIVGGGALNEENKAPAGYEWGPADPQTGRKTQVPIEGGPATKLSDTAAGHMALLQAAKPGLEEAKKYFLDPNPLLLREGGDQAGGSLYSAGKQVLGQATGSFEIGRQRRNIKIAIEGALRAATGANAPEAEVQRYTDMYSPSIADDYKTRKQKIEALDRFITTYEEIATRGHGGPKQQAPAASSGGVRKYNPATGKIE